MESRAWCSTTPGNAAVQDIIRKNHRVAASHRPLARRLKQYGPKSGVFAVLSTRSLSFINKEEARSSSEQGIQLQLSRRRILRSCSASEAHSLSGGTCKGMSGGGWVDAINSSSKWVAATGVGLSVVVFRNREVLWFAIGMVLNAFFAKVLKRMFRHERPETAAEKGKDDHGMPSSHAMSLSFLGTYAMVAALADPGRSQASLLLSAVVSGACIFLTCLRVYGGLHTAAQVIVGSGVGVIDAILWKRMFAMLNEGIRQGTLSKAMVDSSLVAAFVAATLLAVWRDVKSRKRRLKD